jgi:hypothetical protein
MKLKNGFVLRDLGGQSVVVAVGEATKSFNGIIKLNESSAFLWKQMSADFSKEQLVSALLSEYDVEESVASQNVDYFVDTLKNNGVIED